jgi:hypothetical protein
MSRVHAVPSVTVSITTLIAAAAVAAACTHAPSRPIPHPTPPVVHLVPLDEPPPPLTVVTGEPSTGRAAAKRGAFTGSVIASALWNVCAGVAQASIVAGAVTCAVLLPVGVAAVPVGALVGLGVDAVTATSGGSSGRSPAVTTPAPPWWVETRDVLLAGVAAEATDVGFVIRRTIPHSDQPTLQVSIAAIGIESSGGELFRPFVTVRGRLLVGGATLAEEMFTRTGPASNDRDAWASGEYGRLRDALARLSAEASEDLAGKLLFAHCDTVVGVQPGSDASICGASEPAPP